MVICNVWFCYLKSVFILKINSFHCTCSCYVFRIYYSFLYFRIFLDIQNEKSYIFFSFAYGFEKKNCEPITPFKFEHGLHLDHE
jgi:hypothetical protein